MYNERRRRRNCGDYDRNNCTESNNFDFAQGIVFFKNKNSVTSLAVHTDQVYLAGYDFDKKPLF